MNEFSNVIQVPFKEIYNKEFYLKGKWASDYFKNLNPIVLELGCGKGEYTLALAKLFPSKNFIGIDIKGARMWVGAKKANAENISNIAFLRTRIELIESFFAKNEINEVWITFPDPQLKSKRAKKRLTSASYLNKYKNFLQSNGIINLKTDSKELFDYTYKLLEYNDLEIVENTEDLYSSNLLDEIKSIKTHYENLFTEKGKKITFLKFKIQTDMQISELPTDETS